MPHRQFSAYQEWSTQSYHLLERLDGSKHWIVPVQCLRIGREEHVPESSNHSLFPGNDGNFGGNQLPDGSIRPSPLRRRRTICPAISKRAFARVSPDSAFFMHISRFFRVSYSNHAQDNGRLQVCVCVHVCVCACGKTLKTQRKKRNACGMGVCVCVMCSVVR